MTHGSPEVQGCPWGVSKKPNDARHFGYQFYSDFSTENKYRVNTPLEFQIRLPPGGPWGSMGPEAPLVGVFKEPNDITHNKYKVKTPLKLSNKTE